jgi:hypothetical protein
LFLKRVRDSRKDSPLAHCFPVSVPFHDFFNLMHLVQTPAHMVLLYESPNSPHRTVYTDGRELPKDPNPTWLGYSIGRWDGDTFVITTAGFNDRGWLDSAGHPQTEALRITERMRRRDFQVPGGKHDRPQQPVRAGRSDPRDRSRVRLVRGQVAAVRNRGRADRRRDGGPG